jgi:hypothetical protein
LALIVLVTLRLAWLLIGQNRFVARVGINFQQPPGETRTYGAPQKYQIA